MNFIDTISEGITSGQTRTENSDIVLPASIKSRWPIHTEDEIAAVIDVLQSGRVNSLHHGENCRAFEQAFANLCQTPNAISVANGTLGLELALRALEVGPGDEVIVTPRSFIASASCIVNCGATPVFADVDLHSQNITPETVEAVLTDRTRAVLAVHLAGYPCDMDGLCALAAKHDFKIVEDCAQAHGATINDQPVGSFGDAGVFSFCTDKIISTGGEGGMVVIRDRDVWHRAWSFKDHGKDYDLTHEKSTGAAFRWIHTSVGSNYRMTEMQAAIGLRQLSKLSLWTKERQQRAEILFDALDNLPALRLTKPTENIQHAFYKFYAFLNLENLAPGWTKEIILDEARRAGIPCQSGSCPEIYLEEAFDGIGLGDATPHLPNARQLGLTSILMPVDPTLTLEEVSQMGQTLRTILTNATV